MDRGLDRAHRKVIFASSLGTVFEWYDFYLYGSLSAIISARFFSALACGSAIKARTCAWQLASVVSDQGPCSVTGAGN